MDVIEIKYVFKLSGGITQTFDLRIDAKHLKLIRENSRNLPEWARLGFRRCPHCPLDLKLYAYCPVASSLADIVDRFNAVISHDRLELNVITADRQISGKTTAQQGLSSLLGILFPTSGCPHTAFFKPMVRFHLPLASEEATLFRAAGMYLLAQYFTMKQGGRGDFELDGLKEIYNNMHILNRYMADRIRSATLKDSSVNAIILLDVFTLAMPFAIEEHLEDIRYLFSPFFNRVTAKSE